MRGAGGATSSFILSAYKDIGINFDWNRNVISTQVSGTATPLASDLAAHAAKAITLAFATGECGSESWAGVSGVAMASTNVPLLNAGGIDYVVSTGGAAGTFTCASDTGFQTFVQRWMSPHLRGIDFDIEAGQTPAIIDALIRRIQAAHTTYPMLRFSLTLATLANNNGASTAQSLGSSIPDSFNTLGAQTLQSVQAILGVSSSMPSSWPSYLTVNLMTMDYGGASSGVCVVASGACQMGQSALQAAYNLRDRRGVPLSAIELTPMIGGNDDSSEHFTLADVDTLAAFAGAHGLAGLHYWSYDRDVDCAPGPASSTCNSLGGAGAYGFLARFIASAPH
jgi:chitinase